MLVYLAASGAGVPEVPEEAAEALLDPETGATIFDPETGATLFPN